MEKVLTRQFFARQGLNPTIQRFHTLDQGSEEWLNARKQHIRLGGSDIAAAANVIGAYNSRNDLLQKKKFGKDKPTSQMFQSILDYGRDNELPAKFRLMEELPIDLWWDTGLWILEEDPRFGVSPDGIIWGERLGDGPILVEIKCPYSRVHYSRIPEHHKAQMLVQMKTLRVKQAFYVSYVPGIENELVIWKVVWDKSMEACWENLYRGACEFLDVLEDATTIKLGPQRNKIGFPGFNGKIMCSS